MRQPKPVDHPIAEATAYIIVGLLALLVIHHAAQGPHEGVTPDFHLSQEASR
jgi:hypothetical protein